MPQCPVCQTEYCEKKTVRCRVCNWNLTPDWLAVSRSAIAVQKESEKLDWAKALWAHLQEQTEAFNQQRSQLQSQLEQLERENAQLQSQLEQILFQLKPVEREQALPENQAEILTNEEEFKPNQTARNFPNRYDERTVSTSDSKGEQLMSGKLSQTGDKKRHLPNCIVRSETNQRDNNEDSFQILDLVQTLGRSPITLLAIADGMGGHAYGEEVSRETLRKVSLALFEQLTVESSLNRLEEVPPIEAKTLSKALINALEMANAHIQRMVKNNKWGNAGSTIVIAAILENIAVVAYLGDSPMFHYQSNYRHIEKITEDHTVAGVLLRAKMITPEMARYHEGRGRLEFYVGCPNLPREVPVHQIALTPGDLLLLCSDGVSGSVSEEQIANIFAENGGNLELAAEELLDLGRRAGETDNQTLILWRHQGNKESASDPSWQEDSLAESRDRQQRQASQIQTQSSDINRHQKQQKSGFDSVVQDSSSAEWQGDRQQQQASQTQSQAIGAWTPNRQQQTEFKTVVQDSHQSSENPELETQKTRRNR